MGLKRQLSRPMEMLAPVGVSLTEKTCCRELEKSLRLDASGLDAGCGRSLKNDPL